MQSGFIAQRAITIIDARASNLTELKFNPNEAARQIASRIRAVCIRLLCLSASPECGDSKLYTPTADRRAGSSQFDGNGLIGIAAK
jgi:hypothetical protein